MTSRIAAASLALAFAFCGNAAFAATKAEKQAELRKASEATLQKFIAAKPELKDQIAKAPGHAVFTSYGLTFLVGGAGGGGTATSHAGHVTYMSFARVTAGPKVSVGSEETLMIFKTAQGFQRFVDKGWEFGGQGGATAGAAGKKAGTGEGEQFTNDAQIFTNSKNGVVLGGEFAGTKFWKDKELN
jgi:lipid-binding SYLF domain-containing protein